MPLVLTFILLVVVAVVGFIAYQIACDVADKTSKKMEQKNVSFSKDGMKVGVKEVSAEQVGDSTQKYVYNICTYYGVEALAYRNIASS